MQKKHVFITGIAGFIGYHLALALQKQGHLVVGCDNFLPYYDPKLKELRVKNLKEKGISVSDCDICDTKNIKRFIKDYEITHFVHLAAQAGVRHSLTDPGSYVKSNLEGFVSVLEVCRESPEMRLIYASSSSVYGKNEKIPFSESDVTDSPTNLYGSTKKSNELMAHAYHHLFGIPMIGLRFFTVYGPFGRPDMAYFHFTKSILEGKTIAVYDNGEGKRDFTYIDDIVEGIVSSLDYDAKFEVLNLGNNSPCSVLELIEYIETYTGRKAKCEYLGPQAGEVSITYADISKAKKMLAFSPKTSLKEGIRKFVDWYLEFQKMG